MQTREWLLTAAVIVIPLIIAVVVTIWSLDQVRYRPKKRRPAPVRDVKRGRQWIAATNGVNRAFDSRIETWVRSDSKRMQDSGLVSPDSAVRVKRK